MIDNIMSPRHSQAMLPKHVLLSIAVAVGALVTVGWVTEFEIARLTKTSAAAVDSNNLLLATARLRDAIKHPGEAGVAEEIVRETDELRRLTADNEEQRRRIENVAYWVLRPSGPGEQDILRTEVLLDEMEFEARQFLNSQSESARQSVGGAVRMAGLALVFVSVLLLAYISYRHLRASRNAEHSLAELQRNTESILSAAGQGVCHFDPTGTITYANAAASHLLGWTSEELIGANGHQLIHHSYADGAPYPAEECAIAAAIASGKAKRIKGEVYWRKDGTSFPVEYVCTPIKHSNQVVGGLVTFTDVEERNRTLDELRTANTKLMSSMEELQRRSVEIHSLSRLAELLQISGNIEEACRIASGALSELFPNGSGAISLISASRNLVEVKGEWGVAYAGMGVFGPDDCWALRRGKAHQSSHTKGHGECAHVGEQQAVNHLCIPMMAQGEAIGVFSMSDVRLSESEHRLATAISEQVTLTVANLRLRETLRQQSIRDPLTGLFNRRYLEESAEREFRRAERYQKPAWVLMMDVDHFKHFNDTFGHEAGDAMLREIGQIVKAGVRNDDIACRYGGEELAVIMLDASLEKALSRATALKESVRHLDVVFHGQALGAVSLSIGLAGFPQHGGDWQAVFHAADQALYCAKKEGRDRVVLAGNEAETEVLHSAPVLMSDLSQA